MMGRVALVATCRIVLIEVVVATFTDAALVGAAPDVAL
jgi:hypothetical protein